MKKFANFIVNHSKAIVIFCILLLVPAIYGYYKTRINYDILVYLPDSIETIQGEDILTDEFGLGSYAFVMTDNTISSRDILTLEENIKKIDGVNGVFSLIDIIDIAIPGEMLPTAITDKLYNDGSTIIMVTFDGTTSEDATLDAVRNLREVVNDPSKVSSLTAMVIDIRDLSLGEMAIYVLIAVCFCLIILVLATDSYIVPLLLLGNIGFAIIYNMGSNIFLGQISYITKAISAILQLGVTTDFSIFLYHKYVEAKGKEKDKNKAMVQAICETFQSVIGSSLTTFAGFLALCTMDLSLGTDIGIVMAKGVLWGLITVLTLFPSLLLVFDKITEKTKHKKLLPKFTGLGNFVIRHNKAILIVFVLLLTPAIIGNAKVESYYKLDDALPDNLAFKIANSKLASDFGITSPELILVDKNIKTNEINELVREIKSVLGIDLVMAPTTLVSGSMIHLLPEELSKLIENDEYQLIIANSTYEIASNELNDQISVIHDIVKKYDKNGLIAGEGALMKDLVEIADHDFKMVNYTSIIVIFIIMLFVLKQIGLPIILVFAIEFAIFLNMSVAYYSGVKLPFIASIVVGTIQLGATIDYAILMSTRYLEERKSKNKKEAMKTTLQFTIPSIITSALCFFAATIGVVVYTQIDMIGSICELLARGSLISMIVVILVLPSLLMLFDKFVYKNKKEGMKMNKKCLTMFLGLGLLFIPTKALALEKNETVYTNLDHTGSIYQEVVNSHLTIAGTGLVEDYTELKDILNITGDEKFELNENKLVWQTTAQDIIYEGYSEKENPLTFDITYYLDEEEIDLNDMIGKEGKIKIVIDIKNQEYTYKHSKKLYTPFIVFFGTYLDASLNHSISISNGKVIDTGTKMMVIGLATPGLYESTNIQELKNMNKIVLEYQTDNFKINDYYMVASPKILEETDLAIFQKVDSLSSSLKTIGESMEKIDNGAKALLEGTESLELGSSALTTNLKNAYDALSKLDIGSKTIDESLQMVIASLKEAQNSLQDKNIEGSLANLEALQSANNSAMQKLSTTNASLKENYDNLGLASFATSSDLENYFMNLGYSAANIEQLVTLKETYEGNNSLIYLLAKNNEALSETESFLTTISEEITDLITKLTAALEQIQNGSNTLSGGLSELKTGVFKLYSGSITLSDGTKSLNTGMNTLSSGISTLNTEGISKLVTYSNTLQSTSTTLEDLVKLAKDYNGYGSNNATSTIFIYKVDQEK